MPRTAASERRTLWLALAGIALVTSWRVALLPFNSSDLFVDEAQYWFWGQELAWGYYSKPPLIGWILRASTELGGDGTFWIRLPLPLIHAGTACLVMLIGRMMFDARTGALAGLAFVSLPAVALGSLLVSTDTPMLLCFALAMLAHRHLIETASARWAVTMGGAVGLGLLAKYAMIYFPLSAALAALLLRGARMRWRDAAVAGIVAGAIVAPNLLWNAANDFATLQHTRDNADWGGLAFNLAGLAEFVGGQFAVAGPVLFAAYLAGIRRLTRPNFGYLAVFSLPIFAIVTFQASQAGANANWAAAAHLAVVLVAVVMLRDRGRLLAASFGINLALTGALPVAAVFADSWRIGGDLVLARYVGQAEVSHRAAEIARSESLDVIVSDSRTFLADLFYTLRDSGLAIRAAPVAGFPPHHYAQKHPLPPGAGDVLYLSRGGAAPDCRGGVVPREVARWRPESGFFTDDIAAFRVPRACWHEPGR